VTTAFWNHRVLVTQHEDGTAEFEIVECYYDEGCNLLGYTPTAAISDTADGLIKTVSYMSAALAKPHLTPEDFA
jgi:hypothetical protein